MLLFCYFLRFKVCYYVIRKFRQGIPTKLDCFPLQVFTFRDRCYPAAVFLFCIDNNINNNNDNDNNIDINNMIDNNNNINCQGVSGMDSKVSKDQCQLAYELELREIDLKAAKKSIELFQDVEEERDELVEVVKDMSNEITRLKRELIGQERETERAKTIGKRIFGKLEKEYADLKASYDQRVKELAEIGGCIEDLAEYGYTDEEGHPLHNCMSFVRIADIVGAEIPKADVIHAKVKSSIVDDKPKKVEPFKVLSDKELFDGISNAKITEAAIHPPITDSDLKEKMVWVKELGVYILPKFV